MVEFDRLQQLWQAQTPPARTIDTTALSQAVGRYSGREERINALKLAAVVGVVGWGAFQTRQYPLALCGQALVLAGALLFLFLDWRNQHAIGRLNFAQASAGFARSAAAQLAEQREPFRRYLWLFAFFFGGGLHLMLWDVLRDRTPGSRLVVHAVWSAVLPLGYLLGRWVRILRFEKECRPLLDRLTALQQALEERAP